MKIILDSNVIVAAFAARGLCHPLFELCLERYTIITSTHILDEVSKALRTKLEIPGQTVLQITEFLKEFCTLMDYKALTQNICRDKDDDRILALGKRNDVNYIVTGDNDLLILEEFESIKREFWEVARKDRKSL